MLTLFAGLFTRPPEPLELRRWVQAAADDVLVSPSLATIPVVNAMFRRESLHKDNDHACSPEYRSIPPRCNRT